MVNLDSVYISGDYLGIQKLKQFNVKELKIKNEGKVYEPDSVNVKLRIIVEVLIGDKLVDYEVYLNRKQLQPLIEKWGIETKDWIGKKVKIDFSKTRRFGKEVVDYIPIDL